MLGPEISGGKPEFYLVSGEGPVIAPRACYIQRQLTPIPEDEYLAGYEYLLVKIEPRLHWERRIETIDTDELVLAQRGYGPTGFGPIYPTTDWPEAVNAGLILNEDIKRTGRVLAKDLRHILIAQLWPTAEEAEKSLRTRFGPFSRHPWI